ncbi:MAG: AAA family ATPase [Acidimicrobiaceae bacterium]|nr:AAA family ATPase [Acidimicrobiaceae bacterium]MXW76228.1 AAA family ATPase [Acidimicrobiaceae bacterium]MYA73598.1 AAA family ATPase [Acidimicrobiaceae bacterium]MYC43429.1 AAA family ATPase [Acidimicrobiaceae bacterium]MYD07112.1 AAA family ATPase [Acidimicrobiaceae bacterium]
MLSCGEVVIVSGPPGSGKTTVSTALASECGRGVHLESDWFFRFIRSGFVAPSLPEAHSQNEAVMTVAADAAAAYAEAGYAVVWDGIVGPWFLDQVARRLADRKIPMRYLVLRPSRTSALGRVRRRDDVVDTADAEALYAQFSDQGDLETHVVSSDGPVARVIEACRAALADDGLRIDLDSQSDLAR